MQTKKCLKTRKPASVLDGNRDAQALLDIIGKTRHSEGFREPVEDDDE